MRTLRMGDYVFAVMGKDGEPTHLTEPRKAMAAANKAAKSKVTVHGLRRTYATILESLDCPAYPLKALLGHSLKGDVTTAHYAQINVERLRSWAKRYEDKVLELVSEQVEATSEEQIRIA
jgi:integrase